MMGKPTIGAGISLDGQKEFKKAISEINSDFMVLASEMTKVKSSFTGAEDSVEALTAKDEVLSKQLEKQKEKIDLVRSALEDAKTQYGENDEKTKAWQINLNKAETALNKLSDEAKSNKEALEKAKIATEKTSDEVKDLGTDTKNLGSDLDKTSKKTLSFGDVLKANLLSDAIVGGIKALGSALASAFSKVGDYASGAMDLADQMVALSAQTGFSAEQLQVMKFQGDDLGVSLETMTSAMSRMINNMSSAQSGTGTAAEAFKRLGISVTDSNGNLRDSNEMYGEVLNALSGVKNETERTAIAQDIFGKSAAELNPLIQAGSQGLADLAEKAKNTGAVMSNDAVQGLDAFGDSIDHMKTTLQSAAGTLLSQFAPALTSVTDTFAGVMAGTTSTTEFIGAIKTLASQVTKTLTDMLPTLLQAGSEILLALVDGVISALPELIPAAFNVIMKLAESLLAMLPKIVEMGLQIIAQLAMGIAQSLPTLIPSIVKTVMTIVETLIDNIDMLIDAAIAIIMGLADGMITALPVLIDKLPVIIDKLVTAIFDNLPKLLQMVITLNIEMAKAMIKAVPQLLSKIPEIIGSLVQGFKNMLPQVGQIGLNLVQGIWSGITNATQWIIDKIKGFASSIVNSIKGFFGIHSPSSLFRDQIGKNLALGIGEGFSAEMKSVARMMNSSVPTSFDVGVNGSGQTVGYSTANLIMDGSIMASVTSKNQYRRNQAMERTYGLIPT